MTDHVARGIHLKQCRQNKKMTLQDLSDETGLSVGYLSKIENGVGNPSINNIEKICYVLGITANELMATKTDDELYSTIHDKKSYTLHNSERCLIYNFADIVRFEAVYEGNPHFKMNVLTLSGDAKDGFSSIHSFDEFGVVAKGAMAIELEGGERIELVEGDGIMIRAQTQHTIISTTAEQCVSYWIEILAEQSE